MTSPQRCADDAARRLWGIQWHVPREQVHMEQSAAFSTSLRGCEWEFKRNALV